MEIVILVFLNYQNSLFFSFTFKNVDILLPTCNFFLTSLKKCLKKCLKKNEKILVFFY